MIKWQQWRNLKSLVQKQPHKISGLSLHFATHCPDDSFFHQEIIFRCKIASCDRDGRMVQAAFPSSTRLTRVSSLARWPPFLLPTKWPFRAPPSGSERYSEALPHRNSTIFRCSIINCWTTLIPIWNRHMHTQQPYRVHTLCLPNVCARVDISL